MFYLYRATSAICSSTPCCAHARLYKGVASVRIYPYPAVDEAQIKFYFFNRHKAYYNLFQNYLYGGIGIDIKVVQGSHAKGTQM